MNYEQRRTYATSFVDDLFNVDFRPPPGARPENQDRWRESMIEMLVRRLPTWLTIETIDGFLADVRSQLSEQTSSRSWPAEKDVAGCVRDQEQKRQEGELEISMQTLEWFQRRIRVMKSVPPSRYWTNEVQVRMVDLGMLTVDDIASVTVLPEALELRRLDAKSKRGRISTREEARLKSLRQRSRSPETVEELVEF